MVKPKTKATARAKIMPIRTAEPDISQLAHYSIKAMTEGVADTPSNAEIRRVMAELGRRGGKVGGAHRAANMTAEERSNAAALAARARWTKKKRG